jgi:hypothetical protein
VNDVLPCLTTLLTEAGPVDFLLTEAGPVDFSVPRDLAQVGVDQSQLPAADDREPVGEL